MMPSCSHRAITRSPIPRNTHRDFGPVSLQPSSNILCATTPLNPSYLVVVLLLAVISNQLEPTNHLADCEEAQYLGE